jgi:phosphate transport system permease protein
MAKISSKTVKRVKLTDRVARWVITLGGMTVIAAVVAILLVIVATTAPLFLPAQRTPIGEFRLPGKTTADLVAIGVAKGIGDRDLPTVCLIGRNGVFSYRAVSSDGSKIPGIGAGSQNLAPAIGAKQPLRIVSCEQHHPSLDSLWYSLLWSDGSVSLVELKAAGGQSDEQGRTPTRFEAVQRAFTPADEAPLPASAVIRRSADGAVTRAALLPDNRISLVRQTVAAAGLFGGEQTSSNRVLLDGESRGRITAITMDREGTTLYAGTQSGGLIRWDLNDDGSVRSSEVVLAFNDQRAITSLCMVLGDVSLAVGDARGELTTWFPVRTGGQSKLRLIHRLRPQAAAVEEILASSRNKSLASRAADGTLHLDYMTTERPMLTWNASDSAGNASDSAGNASDSTGNASDSAGNASDSVGNALRGVPKLVAMAMSPRGNALATVDDGGRLAVARLDVGHPEVSWQVFFGKVFYEGYDEPVYAWQTSGGADFEPKMSFVPLISGTLKGTVYAMLFAVPLALFGAAYTSQFTTPPFRRVIKPVVEIMAAVPSVVIGFLIALWLAPIVERWLLALFLALVALPVVFLLFMLFWWAVRQFDWAKRVENGYEFVVVAPVLVAGIALAAALTGPVETYCFHGSFSRWLGHVLAAPYDQRNCVIIAFGLGFAVIPIIFSIAEDSLSTVPHTLTAASMALGASRWQTLWRIILPSGSPGIFAGIMIGFGRAVGETMIVLMATGNTPILSWNPFNGMRTLAANIAVEIPEAPKDETLYRVLFLCAVLLFVFTFTLNTAAELVRQYLRKRYGRF